jgi:lipopolysaccharide/colanic/teichoic acid biosynthesis glycosyltransferase
MRPGITGLWQISGRSDITNFEDIVKLDAEYIDTWTVGTDLKIIMKTIGKVLKKEGAE